MKDYYKQVYANKMDNLEEMDKFLEKHNLPRLNQEETKYKQTKHKPWNWNCDKNLQTNKSHGLEGFTVEFYQT